jgi:hypothetical protein
VNTQLVNNILINNDARGIQMVSAYDNDMFGNLIIDHNLYYNNGWNSQTAWQPVDIQLFQGSRPQPNTSTVFQKSRLAHRGKTTALKETRDSSIMT